MLVSQHGLARLGEAEQQRVLLRDLQRAQRGAHGVAGLGDGDDLADFAGAGRRHGHGGLVRLHLEDVPARLDAVPWLDQDAQNGGFSDRLAKLGHQNGDGGHLRNDE